MVEPALEVTGLAKRYGRHSVLEDVSFSIEAGETAAVLGENGAGKSTLAKILAGAVRADHGTIRLGGREVSFANPREAIDHGLGFIPQELVYVPNLTAAENVCLGRWPSRVGLTSPTSVTRRAREQATRFGFDLPLDRSMTSLSLAQQQRVEILKALSRDSRLLLLDEPTAALNADDSEQLLNLISALAADGVAVLYISHRLDEVFRACRTVHVLRNGKLVHSGPAAGATPAQIIGHMLGRQGEDNHGGLVAHERGPEVLQLRNWRRRQAPVLRDLSLTMHRGEILALYGVQGAGAETIAETLGGMHRDVRGDTLIDGRPVDSLRNPVVARKAGIGYIPADRKSQGLILNMPIYQNLTLLVARSLARLGTLWRRRELGAAEPLGVEVLLRARSLSQPVGELSGGNQQKVLVGSRVASRRKILVMQEPTRGVDVGARVEIHRIIRRLADGGTSVLLVTSDVEEAVTLSDRLLVIRNGSLVREIDNPDPADQSEVLHAAGGLS